MSERENFEEAASRLGFNLTMAEHETGEYHYQVTQDAWDIWQEATYAAAREQEGGEAAGEAVPCSINQAATTARFPINRVPVGTKLYTHPPQSQGVPEGWKVWRDADGYIRIDSPRDAHVCWKRDENLADSHPMNMLADLGEALISTPAAPQADEWVKCSDRLPTHSNPVQAITNDYPALGIAVVPARYVDGNGWTDIDNTDRDGDEAPLGVVIAWREMCEIPAGLTRPQPPEQEDTP